MNSYNKFLNKLLEEYFLDGYFKQTFQINIFNDIFKCFLLIILLKNSSNEFF